MDQKKTGLFLKTLRNEKGLTQEQLAKHFNVTNRSVSRWETGSNLPDISLLVEIADFYDVDVREIIDGERKSEMMDNETREVAGKMAVYAGNEKSNLLRFIQVASIAGVFLSLLAMVLQGLSYEPDLRRSGAMFATFAVFIVMCVTSLYVTGLLQRISKHRKAVKAVKIITIVAMAAGTHYLIMGGLIVTLFSASFLLSPIKVTHDTADYNTYIHNVKPAGVSNEYSMGTRPMFDVFPQKIEVPATEFQIMYYNPWDSQYICYMTLDHGEKYDDEIKRLKAIGVDDYKGIYTVTDEPDGYDIIAMDSDEYFGFVYAMIPEGASGNTKITYCAVVFCNYAPDVDVHKYMPDKYLLKGFDASDNSPYRKKMLKSDQQ
ncbi:MAG: helix-turn-helix transcriptional regulator [Ruminococcaceae bacterium]|nr:helix-turn-helix transcriptional regulator [Oscillospiraceae bacterium]